MGLVEKPINPESKGYGNLGRVSSKDLIKTLDQRNKMGQGSPKGMKWAKKAQNSVSTCSMIVLGYWN